MKQTIHQRMNNWSPFTTTGTYTKSKAKKAQPINYNALTHNPVGRSKQGIMCINQPEHVKKNKNFN